MAAAVQSSNGAVKDAEHEEDPVQDVVVDRVGKWGRWQLGVFLMLSIKGILGAWQVISPTFTAPDLDHWCARPPDDVFTNRTAEQWKEFAVPRVNVTKVLFPVMMLLVQFRLNT